MDTTSSASQDHSYCFIASDLVASQIDSPTRSKKCVLVDVRSHREYLERHVRGAVHLHLNSMQLRRLTKGVSELDTILTDDRCKEMLKKRFSPDVEFILYDDSSSEDNLVSDTKTYTSILQKGRQGILQVLNGGFQAFKSSYPCLCQTARRMNGHTRVKPPTLSLTGSPKTAPCLREDILSSPRLPTLPPTQILPHLFLGMARDSSNLPFLEDLGITAIINVSSSCPIHFNDKLKYMRISVEDAYDEDLLSRFKEAASFIDSVKSEGGRVLVHCFAGISRSATICIAYLMLTQGLSMHQALEFTRRKRPCVSPNFNFMGQLLSFENQLQKECLAKVTDTCLVDTDVGGSCPLLPPVYMETGDITSCPLEEDEDMCMESEPPTPTTPKQRPGSLNLSSASLESRSAGNSPSKRKAPLGLCLDSTRRQPSLCSTTGLSVSDTMLHCSSPIEVRTMQPTATRA